MNLLNIKLLQSTEPSINEDGWYTQCPYCWTEVYPKQDCCHICGQLLDWSWLNKNKRKDNLHEN